MLIGRRNVMLDTKPITVDNVVEMRHLCKSFGTVQALSDVHFALRRGEILSLLGENGSGKTTLMNILSGIYFPDAGEIYVNGNHVTIRQPKDAFDLKIGMVHQHFKLVDVFSAAEIKKEKMKKKRSKKSKNVK
jgi:ABC-type uncharacterized transport system ATPase subunit